MMEIPQELLKPTIEELEEKTQQELSVKRRIRKRFGKKERLAIKQAQEKEKLKAISEELEKKESSRSSPFDTLFEKPQISLASLQANSKTPTQPKRPVLRISLNKTPIFEAPAKKPPEPARKKGRPPKITSL